MSLAQGLVKVLGFMILAGPVTFSTDSIKEAREKGIPIKMVKEIHTAGTGASAGYHFQSGEILLKNGSLGTGRMQADVLIAHELVHKVRYEKGLWLGDSLMEEIIAVYATEKVANWLFNQSYRVDTNKTLRETLRANNLTIKGPVLHNIIQGEVDKTIELIKTLYPKKK